MHKTVKIVKHANGKTVVNMPGSGMRPLVYTSDDRAVAKVRDLLK
jgi:hypothetical protein